MKYDSNSFMRLARWSLLALLLVWPGQAGRPRVRQEAPPGDRAAATLQRSNEYTAWKRETDPDHKLVLARELICRWPLSDESETVFYWTFFDSHAAPMTKYQLAKIYYAGAQHCQPLRYDQKEGLDAIKAGRACGRYREVALGYLAAYEEEPSEQAQYQRTFLRDYPHPELTPAQYRSRYTKPPN